MKYIGNTQGRLLCCSGSLHIRGKAAVQSYHKARYKCFMVNKETSSAFTGVRHLVHILKENPSVLQNY